MLKTTNDFHSIVINEIPLIDVRAPIEYEKGAFPNAVNLPIMDDLERKQVGTTYKHEGNEAAVSLGYDLVSGKNREAKVNAWINFIHEHPNALLYCFRGGQRSRISQEWISSALGRPIERLEGGYKAFRNYLLQQLLQPEEQKYTPIRLSGCTGSGKTPLLKSLPHHIDLEGIANHRGSAFGNFITPQPNQINFENLLSYRLIQQQSKNYSYLIFEDEGNHIGQNYLPKEYSTFLGQASMVLVHLPIEKRAENILKEYVVDSQAAYIETYQEIGLEKWLDYILSSFYKARKKLGGDRYQQFCDMVRHAYQGQLRGESSQGHLEWIILFLEIYYDPMYNYQIDQQQDKIIFQGSPDEVHDYLLSLEPRSL